MPSPLHSQELANLMWAIAKMDYYPGVSMVDALTQVGGQPCFGSKREFGSEERGTAAVPARPGQARTIELLHSLLPACLPAVPACLPARLPACLPARLPACLPACPQACGAAGDRMKPQEVANTCWAWATLRHFPGAALMDHMLACAGVWVHSWVH